MSATEVAEQLQRAIMALRQAKQRIVELERGRCPPIAIIGMSGRFPGAPNLDAFWELLRDGGSALREVPPDRWDVDAFYDPDPATPGRCYLRTGGFLDDLFGFDPAFFGLSEAEAEAVDPQQRQLLEVGWEALERAGVQDLSGSATGVFVGLSTYDYGGSLIREQTLPRIAPYTVTGVAHAGAAGRLSYLLGLRGPALTVDTACSSGLVAVHQACRALQAGDCDLALAAGANAVLSPWFTVAFCRLGVLSRSGRSRPFDAEADGYVRAEGCGAVVLKRLADAERDGDPILCVVRGSAVNHNGTGNGFIAPSGPAQVEVVRDALRRAELSATDLDYVEAFGSALGVGDAVELSALSALARERSPDAPLRIGSVKASIGHAEAASGLAGLIKVLLCLERQTLAPHRPIERPNPLLEAPDCRLALVREATPWPADRPRRAGLSSFGFSGTNAHVVIAGPEPGVEARSERRGPLPLLLAARDAEALEDRARKLAEHLEAHPELDLPTICRSAARSPRPYAWRGAIVAEDRQEAIAALRSDRWTARGEVAREPTFEAPISPAEPDRPALERLVRAWVAGATARWERILGPGRRVPLPPHPFRHVYLRAADAAPPGAAPVATPQAVPADPLGWLKAKLSRILRAPPEDLPLDRSLLELGLDSMSALQLLQQVQQDYAVQLYPDELLGAPTLTALADRLSAAVRRQASSAGKEPAEARAGVARHLDRLLAPRPLPVPDHPLPGPIFLLCAPRSGSTLLRVMLAGHPGLFAPPELHLLSWPDLGAWHRALSPRLMHAGLAEALVHSGDTPEQAAERIRRWAEANSPVEAAYAELMARTPGRLLIDKSPSYALDMAALDRAERMFVAPRYLLLVRHPGPTVASFARMRMGRLFQAEDLDPWLVGEEIWRRAAENLDALRRRLPPEHALTVRYEALVTRPEQTLREVCAFLGIPFHPALLEPYAGERMVPDLGGGLSFVGDPGFARRGRIAPELAEEAGDPPQPWSEATRRIARSWGYALEDRLARRLEQDAALPGPLPFPAAPPAVGARGRLFLTGATGFLGAWLLQRLLARTEADITCLVRAPSPEAGLERIRAGLIAQGLPSAGIEARVEALPGDLARPRLGLESSAWKALTRQIDSVIHNGAVVHFTWPYESLRPANVLGTWEVLKLAAEASGRPVHHVSSRGVYAAEAYAGAARILEDAPLRPIRGFASGYQRSKWAADAQVRAAIEAGLPATIHRPGRIAGGPDGRLPEEDLLCRFVLGCARLGAIPDVELSLEMVPVDQVADAIVTLAQDPGALGHAYHLVHTAPLAAADLPPILATLGLPLEILAYEAWKARLAEDPGNPLAPLLPLLGAGFPLRPDEARFSTDNVAAHLPGWAPPPVVEQLARLLRWLRQTGRLPS